MMNVQSTMLDTSVRHFQLLIEAAADYAIYFLDLDGNVASWNSGAERIKGYRADEIIGRHFSVFFTAEDRRLGKPSKALERAQAAGRFEDEGWRVRKDGSRFWADVIIAPVLDDDGDLIGFATVTHDISALKRLEERFLRQVIESSPSAMLMIDGAGRIKMVNAQAERVFGYAREKLLGQPIETLVPERFRDHHPGLRTAFFAAPQSRPMGAGRDLYGLRRDGSEFPVEIGLNAIETDEGTMVLSAIVDISDRKQTEQSIRSALKEKDILLAEIHHRVKNNLQVISSLLDLQSARIENVTALGLLRESQNRVKSMALIHQTLYESKDFARVDFRNFINKLVPTLISSYSVDPERILLSINAVEVLLPINAAIPCGLVVNELISNALKHAFPGNVRGEIKIDLANQSANKVLLSVSDDGIGISEDLELTQTATLGLHLVTLLADQLGAELTIHRSKPTRFELRFPLSR